MEWFLKNVGLGTVLAQSRNLGSVFDWSRSLVFGSIELCFASRSLEFSVKVSVPNFETEVSQSRKSRIYHSITMQLKDYCAV